ncbi:hypothetical protein SBV1_1430006 [Verrucomicrobia bacterium]|nr:hypothetical protein SBV1_1430006 [Verrucomicrobiota bacterium]
MNEDRFLEGKVIRQTLPIIDNPAGPGIPALKRLRLAQGELAQIYDAERGIRYMAVIELLAQNTRGNHYHKVKEELVYMMQGEVVLVVEDIRSKARESVPLRPGDLALIRTEVAHALRVTASGLAIEFSQARFDAQDIYRYPLP